MATTYNLPKSVSLWKILGSVIGLCGGLMAPIIGSVVTVISWFADPDRLLFKKGVIVTSVPYHLDQ